MNGGGRAEGKEGEERRRGRTNGKGREGHTF